MHEGGSDVKLCPMRPPTCGPACPERGRSGPTQARPQLPSPSLWADPAESVVGAVISHYQRGTRRVDLSAVEELWQAAAPADVRDHIVVVGTNGKTSTSTYIARLLTGLGVRTGLYTSPHIARWPERLLIDGVPCDEKALLDTLRRYDEIVQALAQPVRDSLRFFDLLTLVAEDLFARQGVEVGVFESGIGGRLDATRVLAPRTVALTSVGFDHQELLGDTLEDILLEKLGVAPPGATLVSAPLASDLASVQRDWAACNDVSLVIVEPIPKHERSPCELPPFQQQNLAVAERACRQAVACLPLRADDAAVTRAAELMSPQVLGRFQRGTIDGTPFLADTGHNVNAWRELFSTIDTLDEQFVAALALTQERHPAELADVIRDTSAIQAVITTTTRVRRGHSAEHLRAELGADKVPVLAEESPEQAFAAGLRMAQEQGVSLLVTGSTYLVADFLAWLQRLPVSVSTPNGPGLCI